MTIEGEAVAPVTLTDEQLDAIQELRHVRSEMSDLRKRESDLRKEILQALGDAQRGLTGSGEPAVKLRKSTRVGVDAKQLEAMYPDVFDEVRKETEVVTIDLP
jgi:predicted phage-related endonuclease